MFNRKHWFAFSYLGGSLESGRDSLGSSITGYRNRQINIARVEENKSHAGVGPDAALLSVSYLGKMTRRQMLQSLTAKGEANEGSGYVCRCRRILDRCSNSRL